MSAKTVDVGPYPHFDQAGCLPLLSFQQRYLSVCQALPRYPSTWVDRAHRGIHGCYPGLSHPAPDQASPTQHRTRPFPPSTGPGLSHPAPDHSRRVESPAPVESPVSSAPPGPALRDSTSDASGPGACRPGRGGPGHPRAGVTAGTSATHARQPGVQFLRFSPCQTRSAQRPHGA
jgi:hypothetical protein